MDRTIDCVIHYYLLLSTYYPIMFVLKRYIFCIDLKQYLINTILEAGMEKVWIENLFEVA